MKTIEIIALVLSSSLLSAILTGFTTWYIKKIDYKREYYFEIIKTRLINYQQLENLLGSMFFVVGDAGTNLKYHLFLVENKTYVEFLKQYSITMKYMTWFSPEIRKLLKELNALLFYQVPNSDLLDNKMNKELIENAIKLYPAISELKIKIENQLLFDLNSLHKSEILTLIR